MPALLGYRIPLTPRLYFAVQRVPWWYAPRIGQWLRVHNLLPNDAEVLGLLFPYEYRPQQEPPVLSLMALLIVSRPSGVPEGTTQAMHVQEVQAESLQVLLTQWMEED
jgi:hypothetical protein